MTSTMKSEGQQHISARIHSYLTKKYALLAGAFIICFVFILSSYSNFSFRSSNFETVEEADLESYLKRIVVDNDTMKVTLPLQGIMEHPVNIFIEEDNSWLIKVIRERFIDPPSKLPYNLEKKLDSKDDDPSFWQASEIYDLFKKKRNGIFVDCGAHDGEYLSNTLSLEKLHGWTGALIEANPISYEKLKAKNRNSWTVKSCLSLYRHPKKMVLKLEDVYSMLSKTRSKEEEGYAAVQCFPIYSVLLALNLTKVDYFSLDVEGSELDILKTIPWDKVDITAWSVEFNHIRQGKSALKKYMRNQGYKVYLDGARTKVEQSLDIIFVKKSFLENKVE